MHEVTIRMTFVDAVRLLVVLGLAAIPAGAIVGIVYLLIFAVLGALGISFLPGH